MFWKGFIGSAWCYILYKLREVQVSQLLYYLEWIGGMNYYPE